MGRVQEGSGHVFQVRGQPQADLSVFLPHALTGGRDDCYCIAFPSFVISHKCDKTPIIKFNQCL